MKIMNQINNLRFKSNYKKIDFNAEYQKNLSYIEPDEKTGGVNFDKFEARQSAVAILDKALGYRDVAYLKYDHYLKIAKHGWSDFDDENGNPMIRCYPENDGKAGWIHSFAPNGKILDKIHFSNHETNKIDTMTSYTEDGVNEFVFYDYKIQSADIGVKNRQTDLKIQYDYAGKGNIRATANSVSFPSYVNLPDLYDACWFFKNGEIKAVTHRINELDHHFDESCSAEYQTLTF